MKNKKILVVLYLLLSVFYFAPKTAAAFCPVCTVAIGAGLEVSRLLGVDDSVTSIWIGGLILSMTFWTIDWIEKKKDIKLKNPVKVITAIVMYALVVLPLWYGKYLFRVANDLWGVDKVLLGTVIGSAGFMFAKYADKKVREVKGGQLFIYQKVVFPVAIMFFLSLVLYFVTT